MRYWWVNQNQTYNQEFSGGYMWSPKKNSHGGRNPFYDSMREVSPRDIIFSFKNTQIPAIGVAQSYCYECPKPEEFGEIGLNWERIGWRVDVKYNPLTNVICPRENMEVIRPLLPSRYSPLHVTGRGLQGVYLTELDFSLASALVSLIGNEAKILAQGHLVEESLDSVSDTNSFLEWEEFLRHKIEQDTSITDTERRALVVSRIGQGRFKKNVKEIEFRCRVTKVDQLEHLRASHLKPWRDSNNIERLDGENGLLLTPSIDHLFDRGFITFENNGDLLLSPVSHKISLEKMGIPVDRKMNVGGFSEGQKKFLDFHRESVFLQKRI